MMKKFLYTPYNWSLIENSQYVNLKFMLIKDLGNGTWTNTHPPIKCREYFNDLYQIKYLEQDSGSIYGFICDRNMLVANGYLALSFKNVERYKILPKLNRLQKLEKSWGLTPTQLVTTTEFDMGTDNPHTEIIRFDKAWYNSPCLFSLYTGLLRDLYYVGANNESLIKDESSDRELLPLLTKDAIKFIKYLLHPTLSRAKYTYPTLSRPDWVAKSYPLFNNLRVGPAKFGDYHASWGIKSVLSVLQTIKNKQLFYPSTSIDAFVLEALSIMNYKEETF